MTTKTQNKDLDLLYEIQNAIFDYGVDDVVVFPVSKIIEVDYQVLGQGSAISDIVTTKVNELAPERSYRTKMIPSDKKLVVELR